jgi:hypothetical protein
LRAQARREGMRLLGEDAARLVSLGITTSAEAEPLTGHM